MSREKLIAEVEEVVREPLFGTVAQREFKILCQLVLTLAREIEELKSRREKQ